MPKRPRRIDLNRSPSPCRSLIHRVVGMLELSSFSSRRSWWASLSIAPTWTCSSSLTERLSSGSAVISRTHACSVAVLGGKFLCLGSKKFLPEAETSRVCYIITSILCRGLTDVGNCPHWGGLPKGKPLHCSIRGAVKQIDYAPTVAPGLSVLPASRKAYLEKEAGEVGGPAMDNRNGPALLPDRSGNGRF